MQKLLLSLRFWAVLACGLACGIVQAEQTPPAAASDSALVKTFEHPGAEFRGKPFWSWNGELEKGEL
ncbi:MAG TPA: hypothetical protein PKH31_17555, partial [Candidatus Sumerlaeota bacterium]|nr:hypothetical protein [Candidatus Sumerlaeota bacterium]